MADAADDNEILRERVKYLENSLSKSKPEISATYYDSISTPSAFTGNDSTRSASVCKLVDALNRAAHEVETPKPWPRVPTTVLKDSTTSCISSHTHTLAALDQSISRFNRKPNPSTATKGPSVAVVGSGFVGIDSTSKSDKMIELLNKLDSKEKQIITLTAENVQLKSKMSKLKTQLKTVVMGQTQNPQVEKQSNEEKENVGNSADVSAIQKMESENSRMLADCNARIEELKREAEDKLTQAAACVESLQKSIDEKDKEVLERDTRIKQLEGQLSAITVNSAASSEVDRHEVAANPAPAKQTNTRDNEEYNILRRKYNELTKVYNDSCKTQSEMKSTMGQAVQKLKQFMKELDEKTVSLDAMKRENDQLKARVSILERGTCISSAVDSLVGGNVVNQSSCFLANSYECKSDVEAVALDAEDFILNGAQEDHHRIAYLRQAFTRMFQANKQTLSLMEMQSLGRVMCSLLCIEGAMQREIIESIGKMSTAVSVSSGLLNVFSIFE